MLSEGGFPRVFFSAGDRSRNTLCFSLGYSNPGIALNPTYSQQKARRRAGLKLKSDYLKLITSSLFRAFLLGEFYLCALELFLYARYVVALHICRQRAVPFFKGALPLRGCEL